MEYLYHYTNLETLALILKNKTIRFSSLDRMDDLQEKEACDLKNAGKYIYISSWTSDSRESIPMWKMYASLESGVRIKLRKQPFAFKRNSVEDIRSVLKCPIEDKTNAGSGLFSWIPVAEMIENEYWCVQALDKNWQPYPVEYTDELDKIYPTLVSQTKDSTGIEFGLLGRYKNSFWQFQKEWRYALSVFPLKINQEIETMIQSARDMTYDILSDVGRQAFSYIDLKIDDSAVSDMEITISPQMNQGKKLMAQALVEKYCPTAVVKESELFGLL